MAWLPLYAADDDFELLTAFLNQSQDLAFIISDGPKRWRAVDALGGITTGRYCLWHVTSGPLPLMRSDSGPIGQVHDPFSGWPEERTGAVATSPYFGAGHPGVFWLNIRADEFGRHSGVRSIGLSSFGWIGNHYRAIGSVPQPSTESAWKAIGRWVRRMGVKVPRGGLTQGTPPEIWALPRAHTLLQSTALGANNP